jgi:hypothetical protein
VIERLIVAIIIIAVVLCGYWALIHWNDDPHPLVVDAAATCPAPIVRLPNPCSTMNCNRIDTRRIA